ncbi:MAG: copper chaperone PCu(A)C [Nitriliruptoraceae bacterium]
MLRLPRLSRPLRLHRLLPVLLVSALALAACGGDGDGELEVLDARSRMSPMLTGVGAVYLDIANTSEVDDVLLGAEVDPSVAASVEIHETFDADAEGGMGDGHGDDMDHDDGEMSGDDGDTDADEMSGDESMEGEDGFAMMGMREIEQLPVPAGSTAVLVPGGNHLMLIDLADDLVPGDEFDLTLSFAEAGEVTVTVEVREDV